MIDTTRAGPVRERAELLELAHAAAILTDEAGVIRYWNNGATQMYGWESKEALGQHLDALLQSDFAEPANDLGNALAVDGYWEREVQQMRRDGTRITVFSRCNTDRSRPDSPRLFINSDITAAKGAEKELRESEKRYRQFFAEDFTGTLVMRTDGQIVTCNPAVAAIFGFDSIEEAVAANFFSFLRSRQDAIDLLEMVRQHGMVDRHELEMTQQNGDPVYVVARLVGEFSNGELTELKAYLFNDTHRKGLEQQLVQAQKMEGLGTLAGGIAHDFNNILAIILGYTNRLESFRSKPKEVPGAIKVIKEAVDRGAALVQQLLTSARQTEARLSSVDLNAIMRELERMLQATFPKTINFDLQLQPDLPLITADKSQLHQVLLNLCVNARDAMPAGGTLSLITTIVPGPELTEAFGGVTAEKYACIRVRDTGIGMTRQVKSHIFEPFFSTKERGKGTGLGLSVVYGVVNNHRGFVQVESEPGAGTCFSVYLPVKDLAVEPRPGGAGQGDAGQLIPQTILLVEDEDMLRELAISILENEGFRVIAARDGVEAVELFETHRNEIGLVVCDLGLPRLGGREAFLKMKASHPEVRAIVASGYLEPAIRSEMLKAGVIDTIQKPYDFNDLLAKIREVIGPQTIPDDHPELF
ncbi:MAG TPA: ATP-binding protein [Chthoniobacterales bacterium]|nr:ATP-binding protein [Chthoniobacterales bacterium]